MNPFAVVALVLAIVAFGYLIAHINNKAPLWPALVFMNLAVLLHAILHCWPV